MTRFRLHQDVAVVEHDDATRKPREGGRVEYGTVTDFRGGDEMHVRFSDDSAPPLCDGDMFWAESGWRVHPGDFRFRAVPVCHRTECENPVLDPVTDGDDDPLGREWCSPECHDDSGQAWMEQHYPNGVAT